VCMCEHILALYNFLQSRDCFPFSSVHAIVQWMVTSIRPAGQAILASMSQRAVLSSIRYKFYKFLEILRCIIISKSQLFGTYWLRLHVWPQALLKQIICQIHDCRRTITTAWLHRLNDSEMSTVLSAEQKIM